jgi:hypothetical protein
MRQEIEQEDSGKTSEDWKQQRKMANREESGARGAGNIRRGFGKERETGQRQGKNRRISSREMSQETGNRKGNV